MSFMPLPFLTPYPGFFTSNNSAFGSLQSDATLDAAGEYQAYVFQALEDMTISHIGFRPGTATGSPTIDVRIETVDSSGVPTGTLWDTNTNIVTGAITSNTWRLDALTAAASISRGEFFAIVLLYNSGTSVIANTRFQNNSPRGVIPYKVTNVSGAAVKSVFGITNLAIGSSATTFYRMGHGAMPHTTNSSGLFNNTNSAARGLRLKLPFLASVAGLFHGQAGSSGDFKINIYDDAGTTLLGGSDTILGAVTADVDNYAQYLFPSSVIIPHNTFVRIVIEPQSATNSALFYYTLPGSDYSEASFWGTDGSWTERASGVWDDVTNALRVPCFDLLLDKINNGGGRAALGMGM